MNTDLDPTEKTEQARKKKSTGSIRKVFKFRNTCLEPYSWYHCFAYWEMVDTKLKLPRAILLIYLLTLDGDTVAAIRTPEQQQEARKESIKWAESFGPINATFHDEIIALAAEIELDQEQAFSVEQKSTKPVPPTKPGNG